MPAESLPHRHSLYCAFGRQVRRGDLARMGRNVSNRKRLSTVMGSRIADFVDLILAIRHPCCRGNDQRPRAGALGALWRPQGLRTRHEAAVLQAEMRLTARSGRPP